tara:strand:+ start:22295 stop:22426 length:132 start_codon:yes stop_codon:yes gene_type:complete
MRLHLTTQFSAYNPEALNHRTHACRETIGQRHELSLNILVASN